MIHKTHMHINAVFFRVHAAKNATQTEENVGASCVFEWLQQIEVKKNTRPFSLWKFTMPFFQLSLIKRWKCLAAFFALTHFVWAGACRRKKMCWMNALYYDLNCALWHSFGSLKVYVCDCFSFWRFFVCLFFHFISGEFILKPYSKYLVFLESLFSNFSHGS